jgi:hypothetical protein
LVDCLALWNEFHVNNSLDIEGTDAGISAVPIAKFVVYFWDHIENAMFHLQ